MSLCPLCYARYQPGLGLVSTMEVNLDWFLRAQKRLLMAGWIKTTLDAPLLYNTVRQEELTGLERMQYLIKKKIRADYIVLPKATPEPSSLESLPWVTQPVISCATEWVPTMRSERSVLHWGTVEKSTSNDSMLSVTRGPQTGWCEMTEEET